MPVKVGEALFLCPEGAMLGREGNVEKNSVIVLAVITPFYEMEIGHANLVRSLLGRIGDTLSYFQ
jgi:hypothetical protein